MYVWQKLTLALLMVLVAGCAEAPQPAEAPVSALAEAPAPIPAPVPAQTPASPPPVPGAPLTAEQRHAKYAELPNHLAGVPYVTAFGLDSRQDKYWISVGTVEARQAVEQMVSNLGLAPEDVIIEQPKHPLSEAAPFAGCQGTQPPDAGGQGLRLLPPDVMRPGQLFQLVVTFKARESEIMRGVDSYLQCWDGQDWSTRYMLQVGWGSPGAQPSARIYGSGVVVSLGLGGPGPEDLVLPPNMPPGWYRIRKQVSIGQTQQTLTAVFQVR